MAGFDRSAPQQLSEAPAGSGAQLRIMYIMSNRILSLQEHVPVQIRLALNCDVWLTRNIPSVPTPRSDGWVAR